MTYDCHCSGKSLPVTCHQTRYPKRDGLAKGWLHWAWTHISRAAYEPWRDSALSTFGNLQVQCWNRLSWGQDEWEFCFFELSDGSRTFFITEYGKGWRSCLNWVRVAETTWKFYMSWFWRNPTFLSWSSLWRKQTWKDPSAQRLVTICLEKRAMALTMEDTPRGSRGRKYSCGAGERVL